MRKALAQGIEAAGVLALGAGMVMAAGVAGALALAGLALVAIGMAVDR